MTDRRRIPTDARILPAALAVLLLAGCAGTSGPGPVAHGSEAAEDGEIARALDRSLVEEGGLTLPPWTVELRPELTYAFSTDEAVRIVVLDGQASLADVRERRDEAVVNLTARLGLPGFWQVQADLPYRYARRKQTSAGLTLEDGTEHGVGDISLAVTRQIAREQGWRPDLLASVTWQAPTGEDATDSGNLALGGGSHAFGAGLTFVKSQAPLVFFGGVSYVYRLDDRRDGVALDFGHQVGFRAGTILSASPDTSLRLALDVDVLTELAVDGAAQAGSDTVVSSVELGLSTVLTNSALLDIAAGFGVTGDTPDLRLTVSLPIRF